MSPNEKPIIILGLWASEFAVGSHFGPLIFACVVVNFSNVVQWVSSPLLAKEFGCLECSTLKEKLVGCWASAAPCSVNVSLALFLVLLGMLYNVMVQTSFGVVVKVLNGHGVWNWVINMLLLMSKLLLMSEFLLLSESLLMSALLLIRELLLMSKLMLMHKRLFEDF